MYYDSFSTNCLRLTLIIIAGKVQLTTRNILIANLSISNILLCLFTMPLTMLDLIHTFWPMDSSQVIIIQYCQLFNFSLPQGVLCQLTSASQSTFVFFSSLSVTLIAVDRFLFIIHPKNYQISIRQVWWRVPQYKKTKSLQYEPPWIPINPKNTYSFCEQTLSIERHNMSKYNSLSDTSHFDIPTC